MATNKITVSAIVSADKHKVWDCYTMPEHITLWNFADQSWHCPAASNDLRVGGQYFARMEAKDGSFGFDFVATYTDVINGDEFSYEFGGRTVHVVFRENDGKTEVTIHFDPENENPVELQRQGWQAILDNFKTYTEAH